MTHRKRAIVLVSAAILAVSAVPLRGQEVAKTANWPEPASEDTHGYGTHTWAAVWQQYLKELLDRSGKSN